MHSGGPHLSPWYVGYSECASALSIDTVSLDDLDMHDMYMHHMTCHIAFCVWLVGPDYLIEILDWLVKRFGIACELLHWCGPGRGLSELDTHTEAAWTPT